MQKMSNFEIINRSGVHILFKTKPFYLILTIDLLTLVFFCFLLDFFPSSSNIKLGGFTGDLKPKAKTKTAHNTTPTTGKINGGVVTSASSIAIM